MELVRKALLVSLVVIISCSSDVPSRSKRLQNFENEVPEFIFRKFPKFSNKDLNKAVGLQIHYQALYQHFGVCGFVLYYDLGDVDNKKKLELASNDLRLKDTSYKFSFIDMDNELADTVDANTYYIPKISKSAFENQTVDSDESKSEILSIIDAKRINQKDVIYKGYTTGAYIQDKRYLVYWVALW